MSDALISVSLLLSIKVVGLKQGGIFTNRSMTLSDCAQWGVLHPHRIRWPEEKLVQMCTLFYSLGSPDCAHRHSEACRPGGGGKTPVNLAGSAHCSVLPGHCHGILKVQGKETCTLHAMVPHLSLSTSETTPPGTEAHLWLFEALEWIVSSFRI